MTRRTAGRSSWQKPSDWLISCAGRPPLEAIHTRLQHAQQIVALLIEVGQLGDRSPEMVAQVRDGMLRVMEKMGMIEKSLPAVKTRPRHWTWETEVESTLEGLWYPEFEIGDEVQKGDLLGRIIDPLDNLLATIYAPESGRVMYGERGLMIGYGDILAAIATSED